MQQINERVLVKRAEGVHVFRRGLRAVGVSTFGPWCELSVEEQRLLVRAETPVSVGTLVRPPLRRADVMGMVGRLFGARLLECNGVLRPHEGTHFKPAAPIHTISPEACQQMIASGGGAVDVAEGAGARVCFVEASPDEIATVADLLVAAACVELTAVPVVRVGEPADFVRAFDVLAERGFRLFLVEPAPARGDDEAIALADGMLAMVDRGVEFARAHPARFLLPGVESWLVRMRGVNVPFGQLGPRCERCAVRGWCRPDLEWPLGHETAGSPACAYVRRVFDGLLWRVIDAPDLPMLLGGWDEVEVPHDHRGK